MRKQPLHPRTAIINQKQKHHAKTARLETLRWLARRFPEAFDNTACIRPLKLGIMDDLLAYEDEALAAGISKSKLREAVVIFTRRVDYLTALKAREMRIDLHGRAIEPVSEKDAECAALKLKKRVEHAAKNARKVQGHKPETYSRVPPAQQQDEGNATNYSPDTATAYNSQSGLSHNQSAAVVVKRKTRQYDPDAVARLKEKLGLAKKKESME